MPIQVKRRTDSIYEITIEGLGGLGARLTLEPLEWDTRVLGLATGRIVDVRVDPGSAALSELGLGLPVELARLGFEYVTFRSKFNWPLLHEFERAGFNLVDVMLEFEKPLAASPVESTLPSSFELRPARAGELESVSQLALNSLWASRFHNDPRLSPPQVERVHLEWVLNCFRGVAADVVWIVASGDDVAGFVTCGRRSDGTGTVGLIAVDEEHVGKGLGRALLGRAESWMRERGCERLHVQTQADNHGAISLYAAVGCKHFATQATLRWTSL